MDGDLEGCENAKKDKLFQPALSRFYFIKRLRTLRAESY